MGYNTHNQYVKTGSANCRERQIRFCFANDRILKICAFILLSMLCLSQGRTEAAAKNSSPAGGSEVWVDVKLKDAERLDEILVLKKKTAELEALERKQANQIAQLTAERNLLRQELFDAINQLEAQNAQFRRLELGVAGVLATGKLPEASPREDRLVEAIDGVTKSGRELAAQTLEFCNVVDAIVKSSKVDSLEKAKLRLKIDELRSASRKFTTLSEWNIAEHPVESCRILAVNQKLGIVVLPIGSVHGVFNGLSLYVPGKSHTTAPVRLRVFSTRPTVSAATVTAGSITTLSQGNEAVTDLQNSINREQ